MNKQKVFQDEFGSLWFRSILPIWLNHKKASQASAARRCCNGQPSLNGLPIPGKFISCYLGK